MFDNILNCTKSLSDHLQNAQVNLGKAADLVSATVSRLELFRTDGEWDKFFCYAKKVAEVKNIEITSPRPPRERRFPQNLQDGIVLTPTGTREPLSTSQQYKINLYFPVLNAFVAELNHRFSQENIEITRAIHVFNPDSEHFLDHTHLKPIALTYNLDYELLCIESTLE